MARLLFLVFMLVPLVEIAFFVLIGQAIGLWPTLLGVLVTALVGAFVLRMQGLSLFAEIRATMARGELPGRAIVEAVMVGAAGLMLLLPGYFSDCIGLLLLVPAVRHWLYGVLRSRFSIVTAAGAGGGFGGPRPEDPTYDLGQDDWRPR